MKAVNVRLLRKLVHWSLLILAMVMVVSGLGITESRLIEAGTFGLLHKANAFKLHLALWIPFVLLLLIHLVLTTWPLTRRTSQESKNDRPV